MGTSVESLLLEKEGDFFEAKRVLKNPSEVLVTLSAFANTDGGKFVYGLEDEKKAQGPNRLYGVSENKQNVDEVLALLKSRLMPPLREEYYTIEQVRIRNINNINDFLLVLHIRPSLEVHTVIDRGTYQRVGSSNRILSAEEIRNLQYRRGAASAEADLIDWIALQDLDQQKVTQIMDHLKVLGSANDFMLKNGLAVIKDGRLVLRRCAILLFHENPPVALGRKCSVRVSHYKGDSEPIGENLVNRPVSIEGSLDMQIDQTISFLQDSLQAQKAKYPETALKEALVNAVIHRDYSVSDDIQVRIFDRKLEIISPGPLPGNMTIEEMKTSRHSRNPNIVRMLARYPKTYNRDLGDGIRTIYTSMERAFLKDPEFENDRNRVSVRLVHEPRGDLWVMTKEYIIRNGQITNKELREVTGILDAVKASALLKRWVRQERLRRGMPGGGVLNTKAFYLPGAQFYNQFQE
ncbi:MAG: hypothetical protein GX434_00625 [Peptococcaceae bacterium]|nr:hypothetical protein [Peptococcaceae bacterium]